MLESKPGNWKIPLIRKFDHVEWNPKLNSIFDSYHQLERLHRHFIHPSARKLYDLLKVTVDDRPPSNLDVLKKISENCEEINLYRSKQTTFQSHDLDKIKFNHRIIMDVIYLQDKHSS